MGECLEEKEQTLPHIVVFLTDSDSEELVEKS